MKKNYWNNLLKLHIDYELVNFFLKSHRISVTCSKEILPVKSYKQSFLKEANCIDYSCYVAEHSRYAYNNINNDYLTNFVESISSIFGEINNHVLIPVLLNCDNKELGDVGWYFFDFKNKSMVKYSDCTNNIVLQIQKNGFKYGICYIGDIEKATFLYKEKGYIKLLEQVGSIKTELERSLYRKRIYYDEIILNDDAVLYDIQLNPAKVIAIDNTFIKSHN